MIDALVRASVRRRHGLALLACFALLLGLGNATGLNIDAVPDITNRYVIVNAQAPGLAPEDVERQITFPLEIALASLPRVQETRSLSQFGLCQVTVTFDDATDIYFARQQVSERLSVAQARLPAGTRTEMGPVSTGLGEILHVRLANERLSLLERRSLMEWVVAPQLRTVPGVAEVNLWGGEVKQIQVLLEPAALLAYGLSIGEVERALAGSNANVGGAYLLRDAEQQLVATQGIFRSLDDVRQVVVQVREGVPVTVEQLGQVREGPAVRQGAVTQDGRGEQSYALPMLLMGENAQVVLRRLQERLASLRPSLPRGTELTTCLDRSELIGRTIHTAAGNLLEGGVLVILTLFLFLRQLRAGLIVSSAIPLAMVAAMAGMRWLGVSANLMSLGAIDFGLIVDGAVIIVENCQRRLGEARRDAGRPLTESERLETIAAAALEVRRASQFGELIIIAAYLPILTLVGIEGKMFRPMGFTVVLALLAALGLSLTLIPALCGLFLPDEEERRVPFLEKLAVRYRGALERVLARPLAPLAAGLAFCLLCLVLGSGLGSEFIPELDEGALAIEVRYAPSISLEESVRRATVMEKLLLEQFPDEIEHVVSQLGRAELAIDPMLPGQGDVILLLRPRSRWRRARSRAGLVHLIQEELEHLPGLSPSFGQPIKTRMMELIEGIGVRSDVAIKLFGPDPRVLAAQGEQLVNLVRQIPGAADVRGEVTQGLPYLRIIIDRSAIARHGIRVEDVNAAVEAAVGGRAATVISDGVQRLDVVVRFLSEFRDQPDKIARLLVSAPGGIPVPLSQLARLESLEGPVQVSRENGQRRVVVQSNVRGRDLGSFVEEAQRRLGALELPSGYRLEFSGTYQHWLSGRRRLLAASLVTFSLVLLLLYATFASLAQALLVFSGIPLAVTGGILALVVTGQPLSISAGIGFIALFGVAVLNGIVLVTFINSLRERGLPLAQAVREGCVQRLRPVLMTAGVASLGFLPMALSQGAGADVQRPLATVVIGGLLSSTLLTLFLLPALYVWWEGRPRGR